MLARISMKICLLLCLCVSAALGLKCYVCYNCTVVTEDQLQTCRRGYDDVCFKRIIDGVVTRGCAQGTAGTANCYDVDRGRECACSIDACNKAWRGHSSFTLALLVAGIAMFLIREQS